jgi:hypothetical protein
MQDKIYNWSKWFLIFLRKKFKFNINRLLSSMNKFIATFIMFDLNLNHVEEGE